MNISADTTEFQKAHVDAVNHVAELERATILAEARKILWTIRADKQVARGLDPKAADAVIAGRHDQRGQEFANNVITRIPTAGSVAGAIRQELLKSVTIHGNI